MPKPGVVLIVGAFSVRTVGRDPAVVVHHAVLDRAVRSGRPGINRIANVMHEHSVNERARRADIDANPENRLDFLYWLRRAAAPYVRAHYLDISDGLVASLKAENKAVCI